MTRTKCATNLMTLGTMNIDLHYIIRAAERIKEGGIRTEDAANIISIASP
jgi:hypothetical protein